MPILALKALNTFGLDEVESNFNILAFMSESEESSGGNVEIGVGG